MPASLPRTSPATMPQGSGEVTAASSVAPLRRTPALASAKTGSTRNLTKGAKDACSRSLRIESHKPFARQVVSDAAQT